MFLRINKQCCPKIKVILFIYGGLNQDSALGCFRARWLALVSLHSVETDEADARAPTPVSLQILIAEPAVLLADEPGASLDIDHRINLKR